MANEGHTTKGPTKEPSYSLAELNGFTGSLGAPGSNLKDDPRWTGGTVAIPGGGGFKNNVVFSAHVGEMVRKGAALSDAEVAKLKQERDENLSAVFDTPAAGTAKTVAKVSPLFDPAAKVKKLDMLS